jgi:hypothetical protein
MVICQLYDAEAQDPEPVRLAPAVAVTHAFMMANIGGRLVCAITASWVAETERECKPERTHHQSIALLTYAANVVG